MAVFPRRVHDPAAVLDYPINLSDFTAKGDPAVSVTASISDGPTIESVSALSAGKAVARVNGDGMIIGQTYTLTFHFVLQSGQEDDRSVSIYCEER
jgi:hypothetical protein